MSNDENLKKSIGLIGALSLVVGMVIGGGVFFKPTAVFSATGAPGLGIIAWILAGLISIAGGLTAAELGAAIPKTGGMLVYLKEIYGDIYGYLLGWAQSIIFFPATLAALSMMFSTQVIDLLGLHSHYAGMNTQFLIGVAVLVFLALMNVIGGSKAGSLIQTVATAGKLIPLFLIIIVGFIKGDGGTANLTPVVSDQIPLATALGAALIATMFAYDGWINVGSIAGEMKNPAKDLPLAIIGGLAIVTCVYVSINIAYLFVVPANELAATATPASLVATKIFGANGGKFISVGILISIFGGLNGYILTGPRIPYVLATNNDLPCSSWLSKLNKSGTPVNSTIAIVVLAIIYMSTGQMDKLTDLSIFIIWIFYTLTFIGVIVLRKQQPKLERPYKVPLYPIIPIIAILAGLFIVISTLINQPANAGLGLAITLLGLPIYLVRKKRTN